MQTDMFDVVRELVSAFSSLIMNAPVEYLPGLMSPELFEVLVELYDTGDTMILRALNRIATCFCGIDVGNDVVEMHFDIWMNETHDAMLEDSDA